MECDKSYKIHESTTKLDILTKDKASDSNEEESNLSLISDDTKNYSDSKIHSSASLYERCNVCNKKLKTCVLQCKCKKLFCSAHISNLNHECSFDFKKHNQDLLREKNLTVRANKI